MRYMEKTLNRVSSPISVVGRGVRSFIRWHSEDEEQRLLKQAREVFAVFFSLFMVMGAFVAMHAQQISVVSPNGSTTLHRTFQKAIEGATNGSVIYLPGGGFTIDDSVKITKKLTIIGIGNNVSGGNADGATIISGNLWFNEGSSGSAVMACYITGDVNIGEGGASVNDVLIRYCDLNSVQVHNSTCQETVVNQNHTRNLSSFGNSNSKITNNIIHSIWNLDGGHMSNNVIYEYGYRYVNGWHTYHCIHVVNNSIITNNIIIPYQTASGGNWGRSPISTSCNNNSTDTNMSIINYGNNPIYPSDSGTPSWEDIFVKNGSDYHFKEVYKAYESKVGIYSGTGFKDDGLAPVPYIVAKSIPEQTDAEGKLNIKIRVKAGE